ncbi:transport permease protein [Deltaproteobacteria bacterium]|nr:transport permease protein [Deltaproteobacteria bacterium]
MNTTLIQLKSIVVKELRQTMRDARMRNQLLMQPVIQLLVFGYAADFSVDHVPTVIVDEDHTSVSRGHIQRLLADGTLDFAGEADEVEANAMIDDGRANAAVIIPHGFAHNVDGGKTAMTQVILDGSNPTRSGIVGGAVARYFAVAGMELGNPMGGSGVSRRGRVSFQPRVLYNPQMKTQLYIVPGTAAMQLLMATAMMSAMGLAREKELGTLEQVLVSPIPTWVLMLGKTLPFVGIGLFNVLTSLTVGAWLFGVPLHGDPTFLFAATLAYLMSTLGAGLFVSTMSNSQQQAFLGGFLFMMPAMLLSGNMTPLAAMPEWLQPLTYLNPLRYYIQVLRGSLLRGAGWAEMWPQFVALSLMGAIILTLSSMRFRKTLA